MQRSTDSSQELSSDKAQKGSLVDLNKVYIFQLFHDDDKTNYEHTMSYLTFFNGLF